VFIADDVDRLRTLLREVLELEGDLAVVGEAGNGPDAVVGVTGAQPDVLLLDLAMPGMDGLSVLMQVRERAPSTKVVVLSAFVGDHVSELALKLGAARYVEKGISAPRLRQLVLDV
jgi:CheY-like chemotaxis protein